MNSEKTAMPTIAGVLLLISAALKLLGIFALLGAGFFMIVPDHFLGNGVLIFLLLLIPLVAIIVLSTLGGIFSLQRKRWSLALAGAIVSILPFSILGIAATVLIVISRNEFEKR
jgi:hypothetical protein